MFWCLRRLFVVIWAIFWYKGPRILFRGGKFNFIGPNSEWTLNILVENFIPQNPGVQGRRMAHGDMGSLPTEKDCNQFHRTEWQYSFSILAAVVLVALNPLIALSLILHGQPYQIRSIRDFYFIWHIVRWFCIKLSYFLYF